MTYQPYDDPDYKRKIEEEAKKKMKEQKVTKHVYHTPPLEPISKPEPSYSLGSSMSENKLEDKLPVQVQTPIEDPRDDVSSCSS